MWGTYRHDPNLVRSKRNGLKHRRRKEAQRGTDRKARKISQVEQSAGEGRKRPGE